MDAIRSPIRPAIVSLPEYRSDAGASPPPGPATFMEYTAAAGGLEIQPGNVLLASGKTGTWSFGGTPADTPVGEGVSVPAATSVVGVADEEGTVHTIAFTDGGLEGAMYPLPIGLHTLDLRNCPGITGAFVPLPFSLVFLTATGLGVSGNLPDPGGCTGLLGYDVSDCAGMEGFDSIGIPLGVEYFSAAGCALTETAVENVLAALLTDVASRPESVTVDLSGGTNAAPSAAALASIAAIETAQPTWSILTN